jgi:hypothetical protein
MVSSSALPVAADAFTASVNLEGFKALSAGDQGWLKPLDARQNCRACRDSGSSAAKGVGRVLARGKDGELHRGHVITLVGRSLA